MGSKRIKKIMIVMNVSESVKGFDSEKLNGVPENVLVENDY